MRGLLPYLAAQVATSLKASLAHRAAFWLQAVLMALNDVLFFVMWWLLFDRTEEIRGWRLPDVYAAYGFVAFAFGLYALLAGGTRDLGTRIVKGELDGWLTQPRAVLPRAALSSSTASAWGDLVFGLVLLWISGRVGLATVPVVLLLSVCSALVLASSAVLANSLCFWLGELDGWPRQLLEFVLVFSLYPSPLFTGPLRVVLFTLLPAGFVGFLPAEFLRTPDPGFVLAAAAGAAGYALLAVWVFGRGLKRYESGNHLRVNA